MPPSIITDLLGLGPVTTEYGEPSAFSGAPHTGVDVAVPTGTPIPTPVGGKVLRVFQDTIGGLQAVVQTPEGYTQIFAHLSHVSVKQGDELAAGDVVALSGATGKVTGPHLHYEVRNAQGTTVNPRTFIGEFSTVAPRTGPVGPVGPTGPSSSSSSTTPKTDACANLGAGKVAEIQQSMAIGSIFTLILGGNVDFAVNEIKRQFPDVSLECLRQIAYGEADKAKQKSGAETLVDNAGKTLGWLTLSGNWAKIGYTAAGSLAILLGVLLYTRTITASSYIEGGKFHK